MLVTLEHQGRRRDIFLPTTTTIEALRGKAQALFGCDAFAAVEIWDGRLHQWRALRSQAQLHGGPSSAVTCAGPGSQGLVGGTPTQARSRSSTLRPSVSPIRERARSPQTTLAGKSNGSTRSASQGKKQRAAGQRGHIRTSYEPPGETPMYKAMQEQLRRNSLHIQQQDVVLDSPPELQVPQQVKNHVTSPPSGLPALLKSPLAPEGDSPSAESSTTSPTEFVVHTNFFSSCGSSPNATPSRQRPGVVSREQSSTSLGGELHDRLPEARRRSSSNPHGGGPPGGPRRAANTRYSASEVRLAHHHHDHQAAASPSAVNGNIPPAAKMPETLLRDAETSHHPQHLDRISEHMPSRTTKSEHPMNMVWQVPNMNGGSTEHKPFEPTVQLALSGIDADLLCSTDSKEGGNSQSSASFEESDHTLLALHKASDKEHDPHARHKASGFAMKTDPTMQRLMNDDGGFDERRMSLEELVDGDPKLSFLASKVEDDAVMRVADCIPQPVTVQGAKPNSPRAAYQVKQGGARVGKVQFHTDNEESESQNSGREVNVSFNLRRMSLVELMKDSPELAQLLDFDTTRRDPDPTVAPGATNGHPVQHLAPSTDKDSKEEKELEHTLYDHVGRDSPVLLPDSHSVSKIPETATLIPATDAGEPYIFGAAEAKKDQPTISVSMCDGSDASGRNSATSDVQLDPVNMEKHRSASKELAAACIVLDNAIRAHVRGSSNSPDLSLHLNKLEQEVGFLREVIEFFTTVLVPRLLRSTKSGDGAQLASPQILAMLQHPSFVDALKESLEHVKRAQAAVSPSQPSGGDAEAPRGSVSPTNVSSSSNVTTDEEILRIFVGHHGAHQRPEFAGPATLESHFGGTRKKTAPRQPGGSHLQGPPARKVDTTRSTPRTFAAAPPAPACSQSCRIHPQGTDGHVEHRSPRLTRGSQATSPKAGSSPKTTSRSAPGAPRPKVPPIALQRGAVPLASLSGTAPHSHRPRKTVTPQRERKPISRAVADDTCESAWY